MNQLVNHPLIIISYHRCLAPIDQILVIELNKILTSHFFLFIFGASCINRPLPSCFEPRYEREVKCKVLL